MQQIFISSIQRDYGDVRDAVRRAVESLGMRPLMAELAGAHATSPQRALLDLVARADVFLLIVGLRYSRPIEDELNEANRRGIPVIVLRQNGDLDPEQVEFLERVAGGWVGGRLWATFDGANDVSLAAVQALTNVTAGIENEKLAQRARERARSLAEERGGGRSGSVARIAFAPLVDVPLLDAVALDKPGLADSVADLVRAKRLIDHSAGIESTLSRNGISIVVSGPYVSPSASVVVGADGAVMCEVDVSGEDAFGSSRINPERLRAGITASGSFAIGVWGAIDEREEVQQVAVCISIPEAQYKVFGVAISQSSISMGWGLPQVVSVPEPPAVIRRADVDGEEFASRLVAEVKRVFADAGAVAQ